MTSTLDGRTVLPHRLTWTANVTPSDIAIRRVDFLVDGRVAWTEHHPPYTYADDGGYLVTSWLSPGEHRFDVRVEATDGRSASDSTVARVPIPPQVPTALAGTWHREVRNTTLAPKPGSANNPTATLTPPGRYELTFDRRWIHDTFPCTTSPCRFVSSGAGSEFDSDWTPRLHTFLVAGSVTFHNNNARARLSGWWCENYGPVADYQWAVAGDVLTLTPLGGHDPCGVRGFIWAGHWTRGQ